MENGVNLQFLNKDKGVLLLPHTYPLDLAQEKVGDCVCVCVCTHIHYKCHVSISQCFPLLSCGQWVETSHWDNPLLFPLCTRKSWGCLPASRISPAKIRESWRKTFQILILSSALSPHSRQFPECFDFSSPFHYGLSVLPSQDKVPKSLNCSYSLGYTESSNSNKTAIVMKIASMVINIY